MKIVVLILCITSCQNILPANANRSNPKPKKVFFVPPLLPVPALPPINEKQRLTPTDSPSSSATPPVAHSDSLEDEPALEQIDTAKINHEFLQKANPEIFFYAIWQMTGNLTFYQVMENMEYYKIIFENKKVARAEIEDIYGNKIIRPVKWVKFVSPTASNPDREIGEYIPDLSKKPTLMINTTSYEILLKLNFKHLKLINMLYKLLSANIENGLTEPWIIHLESKYYRRFMRLPSDIRERLQLYYNVLEKK